MTLRTASSSIVVGVDESTGAADALRWAAAESELHGVELHAVMVWGWLDQHHADGSEDFIPSYGEDEALEALAAYIRAGLGAERAARVKAHVVCDVPARGLLEASAGAGLLVVGARGLGGFKGLLLGSVSQHCLHHATTPVAVVRESTDDRPSAGDRVVVAVDGSGTSQRALHWALEEARARKATVEVVNAWQMSYVGFAPLAVSGALEPGAFEAASRQVLDDALAQEDLTGLDGQIRPLSVGGGAAKMILEVAKGADLLVVGSRGLGGLKRMLLGSVATQTALHASCPVVVVPRDA